MKKLYLILFLSVFLLTLVSAENICLDEDGCLGIFARNQTISLWQHCDNCSFVNLTSIKYPNSTVGVFDVFMTKSGFNYNYTFNTTEQLGKYYYSVVGDKDGNNNGETFYFFITESGRTILEGSSAIIVIGIILFFLIGTLLFFGFMRSEGQFSVKSTFLIGSFIFFLAGLTLISSVIPDALTNEKLVQFFDTFTGIAFYLFWFAFGLIIIIWGLTFFQTIMFNKSQKNMGKYGDN